MRNKVFEIVADHLGMDVADVNESTSLVTNTDSIGLLGIFFDLQEEFGVEVTKEEGSEIATVGDILQYVSKAAA